jgi:adenylate kinase
MCSMCPRTYLVEFSRRAAAGVCDVCGGDLIQRADDRPEKIQARLDVYHRESEPLVAYYDGKKLLRRVDGVGLLDEVFERLARAVDGNGDDR